jgi:hypothetical protein
MLLKKQETDNKVKSIYESSNICASIYDKENSSLTIIFNNGGQYIYEGVTKGDYLRFEMADSQGAVFNSHMKKYSFKKLDKVDVKDILVEVDTIKNAEDKVKIDYAVKTLVNKMKDVAQYYDTTTDIETGLLSKVREALAEYDKVIDSKVDKVNG